MTTTREPTYDELPFIPSTNMRHSWGVWTDHALGALNRINTGTRRGALAEAIEAHCIDLTLPLDEPTPRLFGRPPLAHRVYARSPSMIEDTLNDLDPQASSQWDSLRHFSAGRGGFYGGVSDWQSIGAVSLGIHRWLEVGIILRGVLIDMVRYWEDCGAKVNPFEETAITVSDIVSILKRYGMTIKRGDLLLVRTGWLREFQRRNISDEYANAPVGVGLHAGEEMARFLWNEGFVAVAADNPAVEVLPGDPTIGSLHRRCLAGLGIPFGELWNLERLSEHCQATGRSSCCVVSVPLNIIGGVGSPANAMAIV